MSDDGDLSAASTLIQAAIFAQERLNTFWTMLAAINRAKGAQAEFSNSSQGITGEVAKVDVGTK